MNVLIMFSYIVLNLSDSGVLFNLIQGLNILNLLPSACPSKDHYHLRAKILVDFVHISIKLIRQKELSVLRTVLLVVL